MRKVFLFAAAAAMLAACSSKDIDTSQPDVSTQAPLEENAVGFDAYTQRSTTRSGQSGVMSDAVLKTCGFGVFGFYTDNNEYEQSRIPDFMYNQEVKWNTTYWAYEPIKYWPNEYGNSAISDDNDKVTYFAYAPYVEVTPASGKLVKAQSDDDQWGITGMSRNSAAGDPLIKYIASFENGKSVDLLWGVCDDPNWAIAQGGTIQKINEGQLGLPWLNVQRPKVANTQDALTNNQRLKFQFKHALAQLSVMVDAYVDANTGGIQLASGTNIYVRQISFTGFALKGALNLNNTEKDKALWMDYNGTSDLESGAAIVIYDGLKDGKEGTAGAKASNEKTIGLNPAIISNENNTTPGVTASEQNLFATTTPAMVIPTGEDMEIEIVYDVETKDPNLATMLSDGKTPGSSIENRIKKVVSFGTDNMENGKHYTLRLHLGMNSVKFDAAVSDWQEDSNRPEAELPSNMPSFTALENISTVTSVDIAADPTATQDYIFAVTGLEAGEPVTVSNISLVGVTNGLTTTAYSSSDLTTGAGAASNSGIAYVKIANIPAYKSTTNKAETGYISIKGNNSNREVRIGVNQLARKLNFKGKAIAADKLTIKVTDDLSAASDWTAASISGDPATLVVKKNGVAVGGASLINTTTTEANIAVMAAVGDVFEVTIKCGDAPEETQTMTVGGIKFSNPVTTVTYGGTVTNVPVLYGSGTIVYQSGTTANATVGSDDGKVTGLKSTTSSDATSVITAMLTATDDAPSGFFYFDDSKTATYTMTITQQAATINIDQPTISVNGEKGTATSIVTQAAKVFNASGAEITDATKPAITYGIDDSTNFDIDTSTGELKTKTTTAVGSYKVKVTATATANEYYKFATPTSSYTVTVTVVAP